jgi:predicted ArsR family transcriptional regulator
MSAQKQIVDEIGAVAALDDPVRRRLYFYVAGRAEEVGRDEAAKATGISRALAAFHLDKLVEDGLLEVSFRRLTGRAGPGAGRPAKLYRRSTRQVEITLPQRRYELAARVFAQALETEEPKQALDVVARDVGRAMGQQAIALARATRGSRASRAVTPRSAIPLLRDCGYEPYVADDGSVRMRNCPFHALATGHRQLVCRMNHDLVGGIIEGLHFDDLDAALEPKSGECCVAIRMRAATS